jgi:hypothetical protein
VNNYERGDFVRLTCDGGHKDAMVVLASDNGRSLMLQFNGMLRGYLGMMPVLRDEAGVYRALFDDMVVGIEPLERP